MQASGALKLWRRMPEGWRRRFWLTVQASRRAVLPLRVAWVWRKGRTGDGRGGLAVVGLFRDTRGVAGAARLFADALEAGGAAVRRWDAGPALAMAPVLPPPRDLRPPSEADTGVVVSCLNPPELLRWLDATGGRQLRGRRHVGCWAWELPEAPPAWRDALRYVDEVWCHSEFAAGAIRRLSQGRTPVHVLPPPVFAMGEPAPDRARFALPPDACVVLTAMDLRSSAARKNPLGALEAYLRARPEPDGRALLVCKLSGLEADTEAAAAVRAAAARRPDVRLLTELLSEAEMGALTASADIVLSLHRAEGFGLMAAEAAWLGRAVVTTGWSAPVEFLHPEGAALVSWSPTPVDDPQGQYGGANATWAEPDVDDAARRLRDLIDDAGLRARTAERARRHAAQVFDPVTWRRHAAALIAGAAERPPSPS